MPVQPGTGPVAAPRAAPPAPGTGLARSPPPAAQMTLALRARAPAGAEAADNNPEQESNQIALRDHWRRSSASVARNGPQLSLFSRAPAQSIKKVEATAAADQKAEDPPAMVPGSTGAGRGPAARTDTGSESETPGGAGEGTGAVGSALERGPPLASIVRDLEPESEQAPSRDFRITSAHRIGEGSLREKALANIEAIRTLKRIEADNRDATQAEQAVLARYSGWGALAAVFRFYPSQEWQHLARELRALLSEDEYAAARASTPNAHFTSPAVIAAMWQALRRLGLGAGAQILEPSMGVGHFFGLMPEELLAGSRRTGVELDSVTARISQRLYPGATIFGKGFEETALPDNYFDVVIGNIPFGNYPVYDPAYRRRPALTRAIHDYFLAKSIDKLRPGGVMALVTSRYTLDKQDATIRRHLGEQADLVGAIRLPNTAFKENAGTEVTTDILFLQKRTPGARAAKTPIGNAWLELAPVETPDGPVAVNEYFARHPEMMLGEMRLEGTMYRGGEPTLTGELTPQRLAQAIASLPGDIFRSSERPRAPPELSAAAPEDAATVKDGAFAERDGLLVIRNGERFDPAKLTYSVTLRVRGMMGVRDAVRRVFQTQLEDAPEDQIVAARRRLNAVYDAFVLRCGPLSTRENLKAFAGDPDQPLLLSLETYEPETRRATKTQIFERRTLERYKPVEHVETAAEALAVALNETGEIHWPRMEQVTSRTARELQHELGGLVYRNPEGAWETADRYLSGNVRAKLAAARSAAALDASYQRNIEALEAVQPADLQPGDIEARLGSSWIPATDIRDFVAPSDRSRVR